MRKFKLPPVDRGTGPGAGPAADTVADNSLDTARAKRSRARELSPVTSNQRMMEIADVVDFTRLSERTIDRLLNPQSPEARELPHAFPRPVRVGNKRLWTLASIETWSRRMAAHYEEHAA